MKTKSTSNPQLQENLSDRLDKVHWHGNYFTCLCVFHDNIDTPAMFVYEDGFRCASCNAWGSLEKLERKLSNVPVRFHDEDEQEENEHPNWFEYRDKYGGWEGAAVQAYKTGRKFPVLMKYMQERKLEDMIIIGKIGYMDGWLSFPVFNERDKFVDWVLRATPSKHTEIKYAVRPRSRKNEGFGLYAADWDKVMSAKEVYVPFGILDMWTLHKWGYPTVTGLTGKTYRPEWFENIRKRIWIIPDRGEEWEAYNLAQKLGWRAKVWFTHTWYEDDCKDSNDMLRLHGVMGLYNK